MSFHALAEMFQIPAVSNYDCNLMAAGFILDDVPRKSIVGRHAVSSMFSLFEVGFFLHKLIIMKQPSGRFGYDFILSQRYL